MTLNNRHRQLTSAEQDALLPKLASCGIEVIDLLYGFVRCPGELLHTHETLSTHCKVYPNDGRPRLYCTHQSCKAGIDAANQRLGALHVKPRATGSYAECREQIKQEEREKREKELLTRRLQRALPDIIREYAWPCAEIVASSSVKDVLPAEHWKYLLLGLFRDDDIVWIGRDEMDSGPNHGSRFQPASEWAREPSCPGPYTCPHPFKPGTYSRCNEAVREPRYLIVESDDLSKDDTGAVFRWLEAKINLRLRAIVDTGGKSLHGWFEYPPPDLLADLKVILPLLKCDGKMFTLSQPCRLPGHLNPKNDNMQTLLYLDAVA